MKNGFYLIGEVSRITGISKDTLHFYSKTGLLVPEYTDPENGYGYYSHRNLWQLDIISACRKLSVPLETVRRILSLKDNEEIVRLLMSYREKALALSDYYRQVADDIVWYREENERIIAARKNARRVRGVLLYSLCISSGIMCIATFIFLAFPDSMIYIFSASDAIHEIGRTALRLIAVSFIPAGFTMMFTVYFQGVDRGKSSIFVTVLRQIFLLVPLAWAFHFKGLSYVWLTFPVTEIIAALSCLVLYLGAGASQKWSCAKIDVTKPSA